MHFKYQAFEEEQSCLNSRCTQSDSNESLLLGRPAGPCKNPESHGYFEARARRRSLRAAIFSTAAGPSAGLSSRSLTQRATLALSASCSLCAAAAFAATCRFVRAMSCDVAATIRLAGPLGSSASRKGTTPALTAAVVATLGEITVGGDLRFAGALPFP